MAATFVQATAVLTANHPAYVLPAVVANWTPDDARVLHCAFVVADTNIALAAADVQMRDALDDVLAGTPAPNIPTLANSIARLVRRQGEQETALAAAVAAADA